MTGGYMQQEPAEDEVSLYDQLGKEDGVSCGVHDPDFPQPLDGTLRVERGLRYTFHLECEDDSLSFSRPLGSLFCEDRDGVGSGFGLALLEPGLGGQGSSEPRSELRTIVLNSREERRCLSAVLERLQAEPRSFHRRGALLGCLPVSCVTCSSSCVSIPRPRRKSSSAPPSERAGAQDEVDRTWSMFSTGSGGSASRRREAKEASCPEYLEEVKEHARLLWNRACFSVRRSGSGAAFGASFRRISFTTAAAEAETPAGPAAGGGKLGDAECASLLYRLLLQEEAPKTEHGTAARDLFTDLGSRIGFDDFWTRLQPMMLVEQLLTDPMLQKYFQGDEAADRARNGLTLEKVGWFMAQIQDETRDVVASASSQIGSLDLQNVDSSGRVSLFALSRYLCQEQNGMLRKEHSDQHQDMSQPLQHYWIASAHNVYVDSEHLASGVALTTEDGENGEAQVEEQSNMWPIMAALRNGCRCLSFALMANAAGELNVLLQRGSVAFSEVLQCVAKQGFESTDFPLLLVLGIRQLSALAGAQVTEELFGVLEERLWRSDKAQLPSPADAKGKVVAILSPSIPDLDAAMEGMENLGPATRVGSSEESADAVEAWREAAKRFAVWPGQAFDRSLPHRPAGEVIVGFLPSDELQTLAETKQQALLEYHRQYLTLTFPLAPRSSPANYNVANAWACGVQMASVTLGCGGVDGDGAVLALAGRFAHYNGGCGYVLKPAYMRGVDDGHGVASAAPPPMRLEVRVVAARAVPGVGRKPRPRGLVAAVATIWGAPHDSARQALQPKQARGPVLSWEEAPGEAAKAMVFDISSPALAVLVIELYELDQSGGGGQRLAFFSSPVQDVRQGFRWAPLWSPSLGSMGTLSNIHGPVSGLLLHVTRSASRRAVSKPAGPGRRSSG